MQCPTLGPNGPKPTWLALDPHRTAMAPNLDEFTPGRRPDHQAVPPPGSRPETLKAGQGAPAASDPQPTPTPQATPKPPPGEREREALEKEREQQDRLLAEEIYARMRAQRQLAQARIAALLADMQTEIHRIWQEVMIHRRKVHDEILENWHKVLIG